MDDERLRILRRRAQTGDPAATIAYTAALERLVHGAAFDINDKVYVWISLVVIQDGEGFDEAGIHVFTTESAAWHSSSIQALLFLRDIQRDGVITAERLNELTLMHRNGHHREVVEATNTELGGPTGYRLVVVRKLVRNRAVKGRRPN